MLFNVLCSIFKLMRAQASVSDTTLLQLSSPLTVYDNDNKNEEKHMRHIDYTLMLNVNKLTMRHVDRIKNKDEQLTLTLSCDKNGQTVVLPVHVDVLSDLSKAIYRST